MDTLTCDRCSNPIPSGEAWPADEGTVCQSCWESDCADSWWAALPVVEAMR
jgi:hypothetical protein